MDKKTLYIGAGLIAFGGVAYLLLSKKGPLSGSQAHAASKVATPGQPSNGWSFASTLVNAGASAFGAYESSNKGSTAANGSSGGEDTSVYLENIPAADDAYAV